MTSTGREREKCVRVNYIVTMIRNSLHCTACNDCSVGSKRAAMVTYKEIDRQISQSPLEESVTSIVVVTSNRY
jgi:transposase-like protein